MGYSPLGLARLLHETNGSISVTHTHEDCYMHFEIRNIRFAECVLQENSNTCVDTKLRGIDATCIVSGDRGWPCINLHSQYKQQGYSNFHVYVLKTKLTMELNHKLSKSTVFFYKSYLNTLTHIPNNLLIERRLSVANLSLENNFAYVQNYWESACFSWPIQLFCLRANTNFIVFFCDVAHALFVQIFMNHAP